MKSFFIVAGESSGDNYGASLIRETKKLDPSIQFHGIGGQKMKDAGLNQLHDIDRLSIVGFVQVIKNYSFLKRIVNSTLNDIDRISPDKIILIDYPGFNLHIAKKIKQTHDIPIYYYIPPQIWAWKESRLKTIKRFIDKVFVIFEFEQNWYKERGLDVEYVGHPFLDGWNATNEDKIKQYFNVKNKARVVTLFPGSRRQEVEHHLPLFIKVASELNDLFGGKIQFILGVADNVKHHIISHKIPKFIHLEHKNPMYALEAADLGIIASGTSTFEACVLETPMIVVYKMSFINWFIISRMIKVPYASIVNIIANKKVVPEYLQFDATPEKIASTVCMLLNDNSLLKKLKKEQMAVKKIIGGKGASAKVANLLLNEKV
jgi:lipid-A-disaccharide synthase